MPCIPKVAVGMPIASQGERTRPPRWPRCRGSTCRGSGTSDVSDGVTAVSDENICLRRECTILFWLTLWRAVRARRMQHCDACQRCIAKSVVPIWPPEAVPHSLTFFYTSRRAGFLQPLRGVRALPAI